MFVAYSWYDMVCRNMICSVDDVHCSPALHLDTLLTHWNDLLLLLYCKSDFSFQITSSVHQFWSRFHRLERTPVSTVPVKLWKVPPPESKFVVKKIKSNNKPVRTVVTVLVVQVVRPSTAEGGAIWVRPWRSSTQGLGITWKNNEDLSAEEERTNLQTESIFSRMF